MDYEQTDDEKRATAFHYFVEDHGNDEVLELLEAAGYDTYQATMTVEQDAELRAIMEAAK